MSNHLTTLVIGRAGLRILMEGVRTVRIVAALAVAALLAGGWMMNVSPNVQEDDVDELQLPIMAEGDSAEDNRGGGEEAKRPGEETEGESRRWQVREGQGQMQDLWPAASPIGPNLFCARPDLPQV